MIESGTYRARAVQGALGETKAGKEQAVIELALLDADGVEGPHITWFGSFSDKAFKYTIEALRALGWTGDDLSKLDGITDNEVEAVIIHEDFEGKTSAKVRFINPPGGMALKAQLPEDKARAFAAKMRGKVVAHAQASGAKRVNGAPAPRMARVNGAKAPAFADGPPEPPPLDKDEDMPDWAR